MKITSQCTLALGLVLSLTSLAWAMPPEEAKTRIPAHAADQGMQAGDATRAVTTLEQLIERGVPVEHAHAVVAAAIDQGIRGTDLAEIARTMEREQQGGAGPAEAADRALARIAEQDRERPVSPPLREEAGAMRDGRDFGADRPMRPETSRTGR
jgi:hypothetical protein